MKNNKIKNQLSGLSWRPIYLSLFLIAIMFSSCAQMSESVTDKNAGFNGGFELTGISLPYNWLFCTPKTTGGDFDLEVDTLEFAEGRQSIKFNVRKCSAKGGRFSPGMSREIEVETGAVYKIFSGSKMKEQFLM